jgi:hypothetical protein
VACSQKTCDGETINVRRHGALSSNSILLRVGMKIETHVITRINVQPKEVAYVDPDRPPVCIK